MEQHEPLMRQCFELAIEAGKRGNHPFGSLLVQEGKVVMTAGNTIVTENDPTRHAELNLLVQARRKLPAEIFPDLILYTSCAPCIMCSYFMAESNISRVVYGVSYHEFAKAMGSPRKIVTCDQYYLATERKLDWIGPILEKEGLQVFRYWPEDKRRETILKNLNKISGC